MSVETDHRSVLKFGPYIRLASSEKNSLPNIHPYSHVLKNWENSPQFHF